MAADRRPGTVRALEDNDKAALPAAQGHHVFGDAGREDPERCRRPPASGPPELGTSEELRGPDYPGRKLGRGQALREQVRVPGAACYAVRQPGVAQARARRAPGGQGCDLSSVFAAQAQATAGVVGATQDAPTPSRSERLPDEGLAAARANGAGGRAF